jgi:DNA-binding transcriptional LysR family regulator
MKFIHDADIKLSQLRALVATVEQGSFGKGALALGITQSAVSHAIAALEDALGVVLLFRGRQGAAPTDVGAKVVDHAQAIFKTLDAIAHVSQAERGLTTGQVRIAAIRSLATHVLPNAIATFKQRHPQITVTVTRCVNHGEVQRLLLAGGADLGLMDIDTPQGFKIYELFADDYVALLPPQTDLPEGPLAWEAASHAPLILPLPQDNSYAKLRAYLTELLVPLKVAYEVNEDAAITSMVAAGLGMTILPYLAAIPIPAEVMVKALAQPLQRVLGAVILEEAFQGPAVYAFLDTLQELRLQIEGGDRWITQNRPLPKVDPGHDSSLIA